MTFNPQTVTFDNPHPVEAEERQQAGYPILVAKCPRCGNESAVTGEGRGFCRCGVWLKFAKKA